MTHAELVTAAVRWLRTTRKCRSVFAEIATSAGQIPDAIGWGPFGRANLVEVKVSRADFQRDRKKFHISSGKLMGRSRWYFTPPGMVRVDEIPEGWGLVEYNGSCHIRLDAPWHTEVDHQTENSILLSAIRRHHLGVPFDPERGRFETIAERDARRLGEVP